VRRILGIPQKGIASSEEDPGGSPRKVYHQVRRILGFPQKGIASSKENPGGSPEMYIIK
jgi:hypothetical protein